MYKNNFNVTENYFLTLNRVVVRIYFGIGADGFILYNNLKNQVKLFYGNKNRY